jgi:hypothetical protein
VPACLFLALVPPMLLAADPPERPSPEENILQKAGVAMDGDGLLTFFRGRTLSDAERKQIDERIHQLGTDDFNDRERAAEALRKVGGRVVPLLRAALHDPDAEIVRRLNGLLKEIEPPAPLPAIAAARLLARRGTAGAVHVLLDYVPFAADGAVEDEVRAALAALTPDAKADPALTAALDDPQAVKRAAAAYVLARKGDKDQRAAVRQRLEDADATVRWQAAAGLLAVHDRAAVPALIGLLVDGPLDPAWRAEEALRRLAGDQAPDVWLSDAAEARGKCRDAWAAWWKEKGDGTDVAQYEEPPRPLGYTLAVEYNTGRVWECDLDGSLRWEIRELAGPMDAQVLPNGHVLIAEADAHRVTERDLKGAVLWEKKIDGEPNGCQRLPDGNTFVSTTDNVIEFASDGSTVYSLPTSKSSNAIRKHGNGHVIYALRDTIGDVDTSRQHTRWVPLPKADSGYTDIQGLPGDRFLVAQLGTGRVLEVSATGQVLWQAEVPGACGAVRLPTGHTLVSSNHKAVELNAWGESIWEKAAEGYPRRIYRR